MTADLGPAARPRPVPSPEDHMADARTDTPHTFRTYLDATERDQLDARAATAEAERDEVTEDRDGLRAENANLTAGLRTERVKTGRLEGDLRSQTRAVLEVTAERDAARNDAKQAAQLADFRQGVIDRHRQELGAAGDVLAVVRDAAERIDRALATYDTTPGEEPPSSVPSRRAQEEPTEDELAEDIDRAEDAAEAEHKTRFALAAAYTALNADDKMCRYHGTDFERLGMERGEPRCDSCKQPWRVNRALDAIEAAEARP